MSLSKQQSRVQNLLHCQRRTTRVRQTPARLCVLRYVECLSRSDSKVLLLSVKNHCDRRAAEVTQILTQSKCPLKLTVSALPLGVLQLRDERNGGALVRRKGPVVAAVSEY